MSADELAFVPDREREVLQRAIGAYKVKIRQERELILVQWHEIPTNEIARGFLERSIEVSRFLLLSSKLNDKGVTYLRVTCLGHYLFVRNYISRRD